MNDDRTSPWIRACKTEDLKNSNPLDFDYEDKKILITNVDNRIYATDRNMHSCVRRLINGISK